MALKTENKAANLNIENYMQAVSEEVKSINGIRVADRKSVV